MCKSDVSNPADGFCAERAHGSSGSAKRRRQRRLRSWLRHERQTVALELAAALHHSLDATSEVARGRGQSLSRRLPSRRGCPRRLGALLSVPLLAGRDGIDNTTVRWLLKLELRTRQREEEEEEEKKQEESAKLRRRGASSLGSRSLSSQEEEVEE